MSALVRGSANTPANLNWFLTVAGVLTDADDIGFQILDPAGVQVFPATPGDYEDVTAGGGRVSAGAYYAYDNTAVAGWTPPFDFELGTYTVRWRWRMTASSEYQTGAQLFTLLAESVGGAGSDRRVRLPIPVPNPSLVLTHYNQIKVYRGEDGATGPFAEITGPATRIPISALVQTYYYDDFTASPSSYYRFSLFNSQTGVESPLSPAVCGTDDPALEILGVDELVSDFLFGLPLTARDGTPLPASVFERYIKAAVAHVERYLDINLRTTVVTGERVDFDAREFAQHVYLQLGKKPIQSVQRVRLLRPDEDNAVAFDSRGYRVSEAGGYLQIYPAAFTNAVGPSTAYGPTAWTCGPYDYLPKVFSVDYTAGLKPGKIPDDLKQVIGMLAAIPILALIGDLIFGAGISGATLSLDAVMSHVKTTKDAQNSAFGTRIRQYSNEAKAMLKLLRNYYQGLNLYVT